LREREVFGASRAWWSVGADELVQVKFQVLHHSVYGGSDDEDDDEEIFDSEKIFDSSRTSFGTCPLLSQHVH
jgi:hypothetical protein